MGRRNHLDRKCGSCRRSLVDVLHRHRRCESCHIQRIGGAWSADLIAWQRVSDGPLVEADVDGVFRFVDSPPIGGTQSASLYAGRIIETAEGPMFMAFINKDEQGNFVGAISEPTPATFTPSGQVVVYS